MEIIKSIVFFIVTISIVAYPVSLFDGKGYLYTLLGFVVVLLAIAAFAGSIAASYYIIFHLF